MVELKELFNQFIYSGIIVRSKNENGHNMWKELSKDLDDKRIVGSWINSRVTIDGSILTSKDHIYSYVHNFLGIKGEVNDQTTMDGGRYKNDRNQESSQENERVHYEKSEEHYNRKVPWLPSNYFLQLVKIPKERDCTQKRVLQIAYNIGQLMACVGIETRSEYPVYNPGSIQFYHDNNLHKLDSYLHTDQHGGSNLSLYNNYLSMTPLQNYNSCKSCNLNNDKCTKCGSQFINVLV